MKALLSRIRSRGRDDRGTSVVEFALVAVPLLLILFGILDFGRAINYWVDETHLANEGARLAAVNKAPAGAGSTWVQDQVKSELGDIGAGGDSVSGAQVCVTFLNATTGLPTTTPVVGDRVKVEVKGTWNFMSFLTGNGSPLSKAMNSSSTLRLERPATGISPSCVTV